MAGLNLNDLVRTTHPITLGGQTWQLNDDYPASVGLEIFMLVSVPIAVRWAEASKALGDNPTIEQVETAQREMTAKYEAALAHALGLLFRWSGYPDMTDEHAAETFNPVQRKMILDYFFTLRMNASSPPPHNGTTTPSDTTETKER